MEASRRRIISASAENRFLPIPFRLPASVALPPLESEKPTASPQRSPETQIDHRPDGLRRQPPCCFSVASWSLRTRRHGVISDFEWTFVHFCSRWGSGVRISSARQCSLEIKYSRAPSKEQESVW